jgi:SAM-dependent methyltransferase
MTAADRLWEVFLDVQRGLPRQGPGCEEATLAALDLCSGLGGDPRALDVGCGPGMQTIALARRATRVVAVDTSTEYLAQLRERSRRQGLERRVDLVVADMADLPFAAGSFDLVWAEGSAYVMGVDRALETWRRLLRNGGYLAFTELVWLAAARPQPVERFFAEEYPAMSGVEALLARIAAAGYEMVGHFTLPEKAWWDCFYGPLAEKLPGLRRRYAGDDEALAVVENTAREIGMRRDYAASYGYEFFVARQLPD